MLPEEAYFLVKGRNVKCPHLETIINGASFENRSSLYSDYLSEVRDVTFKEWILSDDSRICSYAEDVIKDRWSEGEEHIVNIYSMIKYAKNVIKGRWKEKEPIILRSTVREVYAQLFITDDAPQEALEAAIEGKEFDESIIAFDARCSYEYARYILKGRFEAGEGSIFSDDTIANLYQKYVTKEPITFKRIHVTTREGTCHHNVMTRIRPLLNTDGNPPANIPPRIECGCGHPNCNHFTVRPPNQIIAPWEPFPQ